MTGLVIESDTSTTITVGMIDNLSGYLENRAQTSDGSYVHIFKLTTLILTKKNILV
jgi:hypothetical protein